MKFTTFTRVMIRINYVAIHSTCQNKGKRVGWMAKHSFFYNHENDGDHVARVLCQGKCSCASYLKLFHSDRLKRILTDNVFFYFH